MAFHIHSVCVIFLCAGGVGQGRVVVGVGVGGRCVCMWAWLPIAAYSWNGTEKKPTEPGIEHASKTVAYI